VPTLNATMLALFLTVSLLSAADRPPLAPPEKGRVLARVNEQDITVGDVESYVLMSFGPAGAAERSDDAATDVLDEIRTRRKRQALEALIEKALLVQRAREEYLAGVASDDALKEYADRQFDRLARKAGSEQKARRFLASVGLNVEQFKKLQMDNLLASRLLWDKVLSQVRISPSEVRKYYEEHRLELRAPKKVVYRQIFLPVTDAVGEEACRRQAEDVLKRIRDGMSFEEAADRYSADADRHPGGLHIVEVPDELPDWLPPAVAGLEPGQLSPVRRLSGGYSIARLEKLTPAHVMSFEEAQESIKAELLQRSQEAARARYIERLRQEARIEYLPAARSLDLAPATGNHAAGE